MRDATRGGVGTVANELAQDDRLRRGPRRALAAGRAEVIGACEMLGIDPLYVANEGKFVAVVAAGGGRRRRSPRCARTR